MTGGGSDPEEGHSAGLAAIPADAARNGAASLGLLRTTAIRGLRAVATMLDRGREALDRLVMALVPQAAMTAMIRDEWEEFGGVTRDPDPHLFAWEQELYGRFLAQPSRVLVAGCGTGRELICLAERGHHVDGLDIAPDAIRICRESLRARGLDASVRVASMEDRLPLGPFDVIIYSWWCYGYLPGRGARERALGAARGMLKPGGVLLISYLVREGRVPRLSLALARLVGRAVRSGWLLEPGDAIQLTGVRKPVELHFEHRFLPDEIETEARAAGYEIREHEVDGFGRLVLCLPGA